MEKTGLINNLISKLNRSYDSYNASENTPEKINNKIDIKSTVSLINIIGATRDIEIIISAERVILRHETQFYGTDNPQALKSLNEAIKELDAASEALIVVKDKYLYQAANKTHSVKDKDRINGLPKDVFHDFINSHKTRIGNRIRSIEASLEERLL